jgi:hypothetical protein
VVSTVGANGSFVLFLPPGEYRVEVPQLPLGYDVKSISYGKFNLLESLLTVTESKVEVELTLAPTAMQGGKVSGTVTGSTANAAISPSWVELRWSGPQLRIAEKAVQADGTFEFQNVPPGSYTIRALPSGQPQSIAVSGDGRSDIELKLLDSRGITGQLTVLLGNLASRVSSSVPVPAGSLKLSGRVVTVQGTPTPRTVRLRAFTVQQPPKGGFDAAVSSDGTFQFEGLANGEFTVSVVDSAVLAARNFTNEANDIIGMELKVPVPARGRVVMLDGSSVPPSTMWIRNAYPGGETGGARTPPIRQQDFDIQADGSFSIGVVRGEQRVLVENLPAGFSVRSITYGSVNLLVNPLNVTTPLTSEIVVTLQRTSQSQRE